MTYIDTHAHLDDEAFSNPAEVIERAEEAGVEYVIAPASNLASARKLQKMADDFPRLFFAAGIHAHEAKAFDEISYLEIKKILDHPKVIAVGEVGLDYHYDFSPRSLQVQVLKRFLELAAQRDLPLILHCREAEEELLAILGEFDRPLRGVVHCYTGEAKWAVRFVEMGFFIGFTGIVTFKKSDRIRQVVQEIPLDRILSETDSPYMAPHPHRGKTNEPAYLPLVADEIARIKGIEPEEMQKILLENAKKCFSLPI